MYGVPSEEPLEGWSQVEGEEGGFDNDNNNDYNYDYDYSLPPPAPHPPTLIMPASSRTPSVSGAISQPSGLPISTITCLTHNELWHNPEFMKHVNLVSLLQELLKLQEKSVPSNFCSKPLSTSSSLTLSQSASQVSSLIQASTFMSFPCKAKHPDEFPVSILWTWEDCKTDDSVGVSSSNVSHPPMQHAICHEDGFMLSMAEWKAIRHSATIVICSNLDPLTPAAQARAHQPRKKMYFKCYFPTEWTQALCKLKSLAPLLSLCTGEYKADMILGSVLQDEVTCKQCDTTAAPVDSCASSPSNLGIPPSCGAPSSRSASSCIGPPHSTPSSCNSPGSSLTIPPPSSTSPLSSTGCSHPPSPRRVVMSAHQKSSKPPPTATSKVQVEKRAKSAEASDTVQGQSPPPPTFLTMVCSSVTTNNPNPPNASSTEKAPHNPPCPKPILCKRPAPTQSTDTDHGERTDDNDTSTQPQPMANSLVPVASTVDEGSDMDLQPGGDDSMHLEDLTRDELLGWIDGRDIEAQNRRSQKEDIIRAITTASKSEQPSEEDIQDIIDKRPKSKHTTRAA